MSYLAKQFDENFTQLEVESGNGLYLKGSDGKSYFDASSGVTGHSILGYGNREIISSITEQVEKVGHLDYKYFSSQLREDLAELIVCNSQNSLDVFYPVGHSGAEACEAAMKFSYLMHQSCGRGKKVFFISRDQSYHGMTSDALSLGDRPNLKLFEVFHPKFRSRIPEHNFIRHRKNDETEFQYGERSAQYLENKIIELGPENVAAFIGETTLGGLVGDVPPTPNYWKRIREVCDKYEVHLIIDEVWCGTGTSGKYCSIDWDNVTPDFLFMGKTLAAGYGALSGLLTKKSFIESIKSYYGSIPHSVTHQGFMLSVAAAVAAQKIITQEGFLSDVIHKSEKLKSHLSSNLKSSNFLVDIRGRGLRLSLEYNCDDKHLFGAALSNRLKEKYGIILSGKWHRVCFSPSLTISDRELDWLAECFTEQFLALEREWDTIGRNSIKNIAYF